MHTTPSAASVSACNTLMIMSNCLSVSYLLLQRNRVKKCHLLLLMPSGPDPIWHSPSIEAKSSFFFPPHDGSHAASCWGCHYSSVFSTSARETFVRKAHMQNKKFLNLKHPSSVSIDKSSPNCSTDVHEGCTLTEATHWPRAEPLRARAFRLHTNRVITCNPACLLPSEQDARATLDALQRRQHHRPYSLVFCLLLSLH